MIKSVPSLRIISTDHRHRLSVFAAFILISSCGGNQSSSSSSAISSAAQASSSSSVSTTQPTSSTTSLDWPWTEAAKNYCDNHQNPTVVPGSFAILRPQDSDVLHSSEHFVLRWNHSDNVNLSQATIDQALATFEDIWDFYIDQMHFPEPYWNSATKYKVSVNVSDQGYASGAGTGERDPEMWVHYDALQHIGTLAHEFAHTLQFTTRSMRNSEYVGWLWESHANWMAHQYNPNDVQCTEGLVNAPHIYYGSTRNRYCNWQFFEFLKDNTCPEFVNDALWKNGLQPEQPAHLSADPFSTLATNADWTAAQLNDIFTEWALHNVHWDYKENGATYRANYGTYDDESPTRRYRVTRLIPGDQANQYRVPFYWAPQRWGYNLVPLIPNPDSDHIDLEFEGFVQDSPAIASFDSGYALQPAQVSQPNSDWRWSVVVTDESGTQRYSELQRGREGQLRVALRAGDRAVWLVVMATPETIQKIFWDQIYYSIYRYPWQVTIQGARPGLYREMEIETAGIAGAAHPNGGGFVASTASVASSAYIGPHARVLGSANISGAARVEDYAVIKDSAQIRDNATVRQYAVVGGSAQISAEATIEGHAAVLGGRVSERATVGALSLIRGDNSQISADAVVAMTMTMYALNNKAIGGNTQLLGDIEFNANSATGGVFYGYLDSAKLNDPAYGADRNQPQAEITREPAP